MTREIPPTPAPDPREERSARVFVTVAICTQNRGQFLMDAAVSVIKQLESETELLIIDNASTDETPLIARKLTDQNERVRTIHEGRCGRSHARNRALSEAWGEYLVFLDDDELAEPGWLKCYIDFFRNPPSKKVGLVGGPYIPEFDAQRPPAWLSPTHGGFDLGGERRVLEGVVGPAGGNCGFSRKAAIDAGGFDPELIRTEDSDLNRKCDRRATRSGGCRKHGFAIGFPRHSFP